MRYDELVIQQFDDLGYTVTEGYLPHDIEYFYFCDHCNGWEDYPEEKSCCLAKNREDSKGYVEYRDQNGKVQCSVLTANKEYNRFESVLSTGHSFGNVFWECI